MKKIYLMVVALYLNFYEKILICEVNRALRNELNQGWFV